MAKGFTVKAKSPVAKQKAPEWDYNLARQLIRGKTMFFAYQVEEYHIIFSNHLYHCLLI